MYCLGSHRARSERPCDSLLGVPLSFSSCYDKGTNPEVHIWWLQSFPDSITVPVFMNGNGKESVSLQGTSDFCATVTMKRSFLSMRWQWHRGNECCGHRGRTDGAAYGHNKVHEVCPLFWFTLLSFRAPSFHVLKVLQLTNKISKKVRLFCVVEKERT